MAATRGAATVVVGGGIGGLATALALSAHGHEVCVLEAAPAFGEIGAGIQLAPNATRVLASWGLLDTIAEGAVRPRELVYMDAHSGERITSLDCGAPLIERYGFPYMVVHRSDLHRILLEACEANGAITLETGREVTEVEDRGDAAAVVCAGGQEYVAHALIGADGLRSVVRGAISDDQPVPSGYVAYRGAVSFSQVTPHAGTDSMVMWVGHDLHMAQYKLRGGELYNQVGVFRSRRFGIEEDWGRPDELEEHFSACCATVADCATLLDTTVHWPMYDRDPIPTWTRNRITLTGDAAHPMLQYLAQGGCQALEDAAALGRHLAAEDDVHAAFVAYERERIPLTARVQTAARRFGDVCHIGGVGIELRNALFERHEPQDYTPFDWLYLERPETADVPGGARAGVAA